MLNVGLNTPEASSHNMLLEIAIESGIIAAVFFLIIYLYPLVSSILGLERDGNNNAEYFDPKPWIISLSGFFVYLLFAASWVWGYGVVVMSMLAVIVSTNPMPHPKQT